MFTYQINTLLNESELEEKLSIYLEESEFDNPKVEKFFTGGKNAGRKEFIIRRLSDYSLKDRFGPEIRITYHKPDLYTQVIIRFVVSKSDRNSFVFIFCWNAIFLLVLGYVFQFPSLFPYNYLGLGLFIVFGLLFGFLTFYSKCSGNLALLKRIFEAVD